MARLDVQRLAPATQVVLRTPPNWTAVLFFCGLGGLHLFLATSAFLHYRWEGYLSLIFAVAFLSAGATCAMVRVEMALLSEGRRLRLRTGTRRIYLERFIPFNKVHLVRLTLLDPRRPQSARIEVVCDGEVVECPPTKVPREEALCLAVTMGVRLIKVYGDSYGPISERLDRLTSQKHL